MSVDTRMDKEDVVYIYNRLDYYWAIKKNEIGSFEATWMDLENAILSEVTSQQRDTSYDIPYIRNLKEIMQMNLFTKQKETHRLRKWTSGCQGEGTVRDFGKVKYTLLYLKWITNKDLLYSTWNSAQYSVPAWMSRGFEGEQIHVYVWLSPFTVHMKLSQLC